MTVCMAKSGNEGFSRGVFSSSNFLPKRGIRATLFPLLRSFLLPTRNLIQHFLLPTRGMQSGPFFSHSQSTGSDRPAFFHPSVLLVLLAIFSSIFFSCSAGHPGRGGFRVAHPCGLCGGRCRGVLPPVHGEGLGVPKPRGASLQLA